MYMTAFDAIVTAILNLYDVSMTYFFYYLLHHKISGYFVIFVISLMLYQKFFFKNWNLKSKVGFQIVAVIFNG
jgi:hypothetical protein